MRAAIVDDYAPDREKLRGYITKYWGGELSLLKEYESAEAFLAEYLPGMFDVLFLDCFMKGMGGMELARSVRAAQDGAGIFFTTTSGDFSVEGYKVKAAGYLLKPFGYEEFCSSVQVLLPVKSEWIDLATPQREEKIYLSHIVWGDVDAHNVYVHLVAGGVYRVKLTFAALCEKLRAYPRFLVCCRGCVVNMDYIREAEGCDFLLLSGEKLPISQRKAAAIKNKYADYLFLKQRK